MPIIIIINSGFLEVSEAQRDISKELLEIEKDYTRERLSRQEHKCHQMFRLTTSDKDATYEWYKDRVEDRIDGTCMWFLHHEHFQRWLEPEHCPASTLYSASSTPLSEAVFT